MTQILLIEPKGILMNTNTKKSNPYDWINPIADPELFAGREEELSTIMEEIMRLKGEKPIQPIIAVTGERRVGKTSLLRRIEEKCDKESLKTFLIPIDDRMANDNWEFWHEIFSALFLAARDEGIMLSQQSEKQMGFQIQATEHSERPQSPTLRDLLLPEAYKIHLSTSSSQSLSSYAIQNDLQKLTEAFQQIGYEGFVLMLDEAHILLSVQEMKQQVRNLIQRADRWGLVFAGETTLGNMFTDPSEPFFGQANVIPLRNFTTLDDIAECALLPLSDAEIKLMNPMTTNYLARLSRGKPNQIRLICSSIYKRYMHGQQDDLNITIDVLDDVLENIAQAYEDTDLKNRVDLIHRLDSVDLELLYNLTRYPNWNIQDIVDLDESFRGESKSDLAIARRKRKLEEKQRYFVNLGLMADDQKRYILGGGEFLSLYLRFFYETRKYGELSRKLILGKGPPTPFGETNEKLVRSLAYSLGQGPELQRLIFHQYHRDFGDIIGTVKRRFSVLEDLKNGKKPKSEDLSELISECFSVCELIDKEGSYYLLCLSVRSRDNPRELIQVELYFDLRDRLSIDLTSLFNLLNQQAEDARVLIEGYSGFWVELPSLAGLLGTAGTTLEEFMEGLPLVGKWRLASVQHAVQSREEGKDSQKEDHKDADADEPYKWVILYGKGDEENAEEYIIQKLGQTEKRNEQARLYNDLGYIRCGNKLKKNDLGRRDLETAIDLHYSDLSVTLLNLSCLDIDEGNYEKGIEKIEAALLLSLSPVQIGAEYLRLRLPEYRLGFGVRWEQHPANVLETSYINLAYALLKSKGYGEAHQALQEGSELFPSSARLKHALARLYLFNKRADLAIPIYRQLSELSSLPDRGIEHEIRYFSRHFSKKSRKKTRDN